MRVFICAASNKTDISVFATSAAVPIFVAVSAFACLAASIVVYVPVPAFIAVTLSTSTAIFVAVPILIVFNVSQFYSLFFPAFSVTPNWNLKFRNDLFK